LAESSLLFHNMIRAKNVIGSVGSDPEIAACPSWNEPAVIGCRNR